MTRFLGRHSDVRAHIEAAHDEGRDVRVVDAGRDKASALDGFARGLGLPTWFGHNWDALLDSLRELRGHDGRPVEIVWDHAAALRSSDPAAYETALEVLEEAASGRPDLHVTVVAR